MEGGGLYSSLSGEGISGGPGGFGEGSGGMSPFTVISMPSNTGRPFEADEGGRAHRGYEVDEGVRDGVTSPLLAALQDRRAQGSPAKEEGGQLAGGQWHRRAPACGGPGRQGPVAFAGVLDKFGIPQAESSFCYAPDGSIQTRLPTFFFVTRT